MIVALGEAVMDLLPVRAADGGEAWRAAPGGSPLNVAVGIARLGVPAAYLWALSTDLFGDRLLAHLAASGVDRRLLVRSPRPSTLALVAIAGGEADYAFFDEGSAGRGFDPFDAPPLPEDARILHIGSYVLGVEPVGSAIERYAAEAKRRGLLVSLDVNVRARLLADEAGYRARLGRLFGLCDVVKASQPDLAFLAPGQDPAVWAADRIAAGARLAVVTLGGEGALAAHGAERVRAPAVRAAVVDTVGAGDSFMAGLLAALWEQTRFSAAALDALSAAEVAAALRFAAAAAALTCGRVGADPPWRADLDQALS